MLLTSGPSLCSFLPKKKGGGGRREIVFKSTEHWLFFPGSVPSTAYGSQICVAPVPGEPSALSGSKGTAAWSAQTYMPAKHAYIEIHNFKGPFNVYGL